MTPPEVRAFHENPNLGPILQVRLWDEEAKIPGEPTPPFAHYAPMLQRVVDTDARGESNR
jgi:predicted HD phosphohydrolase